MARLYQKIDGEAVPLGGGGGGSVDIDGITITRNSSTNQIQVADSITSKVNELNNTASDANKVLTANGDGTATWENGYTEGFYGTTAEWNALSYSQQKAWVQKNPKVTFTDDYVSNIKQTVDGCMSSTNENDVVGASALKEALTISTTEQECGTFLNYKRYIRAFKLAEILEITTSTWTEITQIDFTGVAGILSAKFVKPDTGYVMFVDCYLKTQGNHRASVMSNRAKVENGALIPLTQTVNTDYYFVVEYYK